MDGNTAFFLIFFVGFTFVSSKLYFGRRHKEIAAAKKAAAARRYCPTCGHPMKKENHQ